MKINFAQLNNHLAKSLLPIYLVTGEEILLVSDAIKAISSALTLEGFQEKKIVEITAHFNWSNFKAEISTVSLFSAKQIVECRFNQLKINKEAAEWLVAFCQKPIPDTVLLITVAKADSATQKSTWYKTIEKTGLIVTIWPPQKNEIVQFIKTRLAAYQLTAAPDVIELLMNLNEGNLLALQQSIEKLSLLYQNKALNYLEVTQALHDNARYSVFALSDCVLAGQSQQIMKTLQQLQLEQIEPILILWVLHKELVTMININASLKTMNIDTALQKNAVWPKRYPLIKAALQRLQKQDLNILLTACSRLDMMIKGLVKGNVWDELLSLALQLAGVSIFDKGVAYDLQ
jgi:DNA polymerase-3 subunit delta